MSTFRLVLVPGIITAAVTLLRLALAVMERRQTAARPA